MPKSEIKMKMSLDTSGVKAGLAKAKNGIKSFSTSAVSMLKKVATGGITAMGVGFALATRAALDYGKEMLNLSQLANTNFKDFQKLAEGAKTVGVQGDKLADILKDTSDKIGDFLETGGGPLADYFENIAPLIGQTADEFRGLSGADALQKYYDGLQQANLDSETMTFYMEAIASDSAALIPLLNDGGAAFKSLGDAAEESGRIMSESTAESLKNASNALDKFKQKTTIFAGLVVGNLDVILNGVAVSLREINQEDKLRGDRVQALIRMQREGLSISESDLTLAIDRRTTEGELAEMLKRRGVSRLNLALAVAAIRKEEREEARAIAEEEKKALDIKKAALKATADDLAAQKEISKARKKLNEASAAAGMESISNSEKLIELDRELVELGDSRQPFRNGSKGELDDIKNLQRQLEIIKEIEKVRDAVSKGEKASDDAMVAAGKVANDRQNKAHDKAQERAKKAIEDAETKVDQGLQSKLLDAQTAQRADVVHSVEKEIELRERIQRIVDETGKTEAQARIAAEAMMKIEAGADLNQSGFITHKERRAWEKQQKVLRREQRARNLEEKRQERELGRRKRRGEKAEDILKDFAERKLKKEDEAAKKQGKEAVANLKKAREEAKAAAGKVPKKPENAVVKGLMPTLEKQLAELVKINKALKCEG